MRRTIRLRVLAFAGCAALVTMIVAVATIVIFEAVLPSRKLTLENLETLERIRCGDRSPLSSGRSITCDIRELKNDWELNGADFVLIKASGFFIASNPQYRTLWWSFSDPEFIRQFRRITNRETPTGETWRLYSEGREVGDRQVEIMVGQRLSAPWLLTGDRVSPEVDKRLRGEVSKIASRLTWSGTQIEARRISSNVDGWEVVDSQSGRVIRWNGEIPAFYPKGRAFTGSSIRVHREGPDLFLVRQDGNEELVAVSIAPLGSLLWFLLLVFGIGLGTLLFAYVVGVEWLRRYFIPQRGRPISLAKALASGEGPSVEFKHGLTEDAVLRAITAFANTSSGTIFIGVDDEGRVRGLDLPTMKARDEFQHKVFTLVRERIQPCPPLHMDFDSDHGAVVARLFVPRGDEPLYYLRGVSYVRHGESSVTPRPEQITRILTQYAF
jgi:hypothetical protein